MLPPVFQGFFFFLFLLWQLTVLMKQTRQAVHAFKQSILLRCLWHRLREKATAEVLFELTCYGKEGKIIDQRVQYLNQPKPEIANFIFLQRRIVHPVRAERTRRIYRKDRSRGSNQGFSGD
jgi:hypothetical protein